MIQDNIVNMRAEHFNAFIKEFERAGGLHLKGKRLRITLSPISGLPRCEIFGIVDIARLVLLENKQFVAEIFFDNGSVVQLSSFDAIEQIDLM